MLISALSADLASVENALASLPSLCLASQCAAAMEDALGNCSGRPSEQAIQGNGGFTDVVQSMSKYYDRNEAGLYRTDGESRWFVHRLLQEDGQ